jgi:hypothetical protein
MSDRKSAYKFDPRIGPDITAIVAKHPTRCRVYYRGSCYKYMRCANKACPRHRKKYWRRYGSLEAAKYASPNPKQSYCCDACAREGARVRRVESSRRYRANFPEVVRANQRRAYHRYRLKLEANKRSNRR